jgi:hypothetical protein
VGKSVSQYISLKSDTSSKNPPINLIVDKWHTVEAGGITDLVPTESSKTGALWATYLNVKTPKIGGASELVIRWVRQPKGINDATGYETKQLVKGETTFVKDVWLFQAKKGQPVVLQVKANGKATITTRELKLAIQ